MARLLRGSPAAGRRGCYAGLVPSRPNQPRDGTEAAPASPGGEPADLGDQPAGEPADGFGARLAALRALLASPPDDDGVAECYGELLELARGDDARMDQVRRLGDELRALQDAGELPRTMLARTRRRPSNPPGRQ
jgi:hypothetical protein